MLALGTCQPLALVTSLVELQADVNEVAGSGISAACFAKSPEQVHELLRLKADFHTPVMPLGMTPFTQRPGLGVWGV